MHAESEVCISTVVLPFVDSRLNMTRSISARTAWLQLYIGVSYLDKSNCSCSYHAYPMFNAVA